MALIQEKSTAGAPNWSSGGCRRWSNLYLSSD